MLIDEAIEKNEKEAFKRGVCGYRETAKSIRLGNSALREVQRLRTDKFLHVLERLPGETA